MRRYTGSTAGKAVEKGKGVFFSSVLYGARDKKMMIGLSNLMGFMPLIVFPANADEKVNKKKEDLHENKNSIMYGNGIFCSYTRLRMCNTA